MKMTEQQATINIEKDTQWVSHGDQDSKVARQFLRQVLQQLGKKVPDELTINSWELLNLIITELRLRNMEIIRLRALNKGLAKKLETEKQIELKLNDGWYDQIMKWSKEEQERVGKKA